MEGTQPMEQRAVHGIANPRTDHFVAEHPRWTGRGGTDVRLVQHGHRARQPRRPRAGLVFCLMSVAPACVTDHLLGDLGADASTSSASPDAVDEPLGETSRSSESPDVDDDVGPGEDGFVELDRDGLCEAYCAGGCLSGRSQEHCLYNCLAEFTYAEHPDTPETCEDGWVSYVECMVENDCVGSRCSGPRASYFGAGCWDDCPFINEMSPNEMGSVCILEWGCRAGETPRTMACSETECSCFSAGDLVGSCFLDDFCSATDASEVDAAILGCCGFDDQPPFPAYP